MSSFKSKIAYRQLRKFKQVIKAASLRPLREAKTVALIYNVEEMSWKEVSAIIKYFESKGKSVSTLGYLNEKELNHAYTPNFKHMFFCNEQMNFWMLPKVSGVKRFVTTPYDYLINLDVKGELALQAISAYSCAQTRIGRYQEKFEFCQDLMVQVEASSGTELFEYIKDNIIK